MAPGVKLPRELLYEMVGLIVRNRRWARCRVHSDFDNYLINRMGPWLLNVQQLNLQIGTYLQQIFNFIKNLKAPFASSFTGMLLQSPIDVAKAFCSELELHVQNYTMTAEITDSSNLTEILASAKSALKIWCQVAANEAELQLIIEHMALFREEYSQKNVVLAFETL